MFKVITERRSHTPCTDRYFPHSETQIVEIINIFYPTDFPPRCQYLPCDITMTSTCNDIVDTISTQRIGWETVPQQMYFLILRMFCIEVH